MICPNGYRSRAGARRTAKLIRRTDGALWRVYHCLACGLWHLGGLEDKHKAVGGRLYATYAKRRRA